ncbi:MAG: sucrose phosphorylase [Spirochaetales bacterium]|nr:sucrose phosphorylase [Spirochaetales bacterium]
MLITYADSLGRNLGELKTILDRWYEGALEGIHILPFFPSSGDRGFAPECYDRILPQFGSWDDVESLGEKYTLMFDFMINHLSPASPYFRDYQEKHDKSDWKDLFLKVTTAWEGRRPTEEEIDKIYKRKDKAPFETITFQDGTTEDLWCTFSPEQMDLDVNAPVTGKFIEETLTGLISRGASFIRLDAFAYCIKKPGTDCFFVKPEIWNLLHKIEKSAAGKGAQILPEIHEHYSIQMDLASRDFWVYDFALPMLVLHTLSSGNSVRLRHWLTICPRKQFTTLDTHDGIGIVDVKDLLSDEEVNNAMEALYSSGANVKKKYSSAEYNNLDIYQINCTYYSALGNDDAKYLLARAIQFFAPGIPQVYYVGLLAGENDIELLEKTKQGRDINRHYFSLEEVAQNQERPVIRELNRLMRFRNSHPAFSGACLLPECGEDKLIIRREEGSEFAQLEADLNSSRFTVTFTGKEGEISRL